MAVGSILASCRVRSVGRCGYFPICFVAVVIDLVCRPAPTMAFASKFPLDFPLSNSNLDSSRLGMTCIAKVLWWNV